MNVYGLQIHRDIPFDDYLKLPGISYSTIKHNGKTIEATPKMRLGTKVHNYLLTPAEYDHSDADIVKPLARELQNVLGDLLRFLLPELAVTAMFEADGRKMPYKGRIDLCVPGRIVIDIKVTEKLDIAYFGYDCQLTGYARALRAPIAVIVAIHPKTKKTTVVRIDMRDDWWDYQIYNLGA